ncbi:MAG TPA: hypothetical protein VH880_03650, partial [Anaeromyxobacteraceae bacterium]
WALSGTGLRGLGDLLRAPAFVAWKIALALHDRVAPQAWIRTARDGEGRPPDRPAAGGPAQRAESFTGWRGRPGHRGAGA